MTLAVGFGTVTVASYGYLDAGGAEPAGLPGAVVDPMTTSTRDLGPEQMNAFIDLLRFSPDRITVDPSVSILRTVENPFDRVPPHASTAWVIRWQGRVWWVVVDYDQRDGPVVGWGFPGRDADSFRHWLIQRIVSSRSVTRGDLYTPLPPIKFTIEPGGER